MQATQQKVDILIGMKQFF